MSEQHWRNGKEQLAPFPIMAGPACLSDDQQDSSDDDDWRDSISQTTRVKKNASYSKNADDLSSLLLEVSILDAAGSLFNEHQPGPSWQRTPLVDSELDLEQLGLLDLNANSISTVPTETVSNGCEPDQTHEGSVGDNGQRVPQTISFPTSPLTFHSNTNWPDGCKDEVGDKISTALEAKGEDKARSEKKKILAMLSSDEGLGQFPSITITEYAALIKSVSSDDSPVVLPQVKKKSMLSFSFEGYMQNKFKEACKEVRTENNGSIQVSSGSSQLKRRRTASLESGPSSQEGDFVIEAKMHKEHFVSFPTSPLIFHGCKDEVDDEMATALEAKGEDNARSEKNKILAMLLSDEELGQLPSITDRAVFNEVYTERVRTESNGSSPLKRRRTASVESGPSSQEGDFVEAKRLKEHFRTRKYE